MIIIMFSNQAHAGSRPVHAWFLNKLLLCESLCVCVCVCVCVSVCVCVCARARARACVSVSVCVYVCLSVCLSVQAGVIGDAWKCLRDFQRGREGLQPTPVRNLNGDLFSTPAESLQRWQPKFQLNLWLEPVISHINQHVDFTLTSLSSYLVNHWAMMLFHSTKYRFVLHFAFFWMNC